MSYLYKTPEDLLPCPHCGGEAEARDGSSTRPYIRCKSCGCRTGASYDMDKLKEAWNRRAGTTCELRCESRGGGRMISDTERRDVARRLRDQECKHKWRNQIMNDEKRNEVSSKLMDAAKCVSKDNIGCILNDALHGEEKLSGINEDCSVCCSVSLAELADLIKPSCDRDALLALADDLERPMRDGGYSKRIARRIREALGVHDA